MRNPLKIKSALESYFTTKRFSVMKSHVTCHILQFLLLKNTKLARIHTHTHFVSNGIFCCALYGLSCLSARLLWPRWVHAIHYMWKCRTLKEKWASRSTMPDLILAFMAFCWSSNQIAYACLSTWLAAEVHSDKLLLDIYHTIRFV